MGAFEFEMLGATPTIYHQESKAGNEQQDASLFTFPNRIFQRATSAHYQEQEIKLAVYSVMGLQGQKIQR